MEGTIMGAGTTSGRSGGGGVGASLSGISRSSASIDWKAAGARSLYTKDSWPSVLELWLSPEPKPMRSSALRI